MPTTGEGFRGSALHHSVLHFEKKYGRAAAHDTVAQLPAQWRPLVQPNQPALGILGAHVYPYPFVGDLVRTMRTVTKRPDEDAFVRELVTAGLDQLLSTMHRVLVRWLVSPRAFLDRRQEIWELYHTHGKLDVLELGDHHYVIEDRDWSNTDAIVCRINLEGRKKMLEVMGLREITAVRETCRARGDASCRTRFGWL